MIQGLTWFVCGVKRSSIHLDSTHVIVRHSGYQELPFVHATTPSQLNAPNILPTRPLLPRPLERLNSARYGALCHSRPRHHPEVRTSIATTASQSLTPSSVLEQSSAALKESKRLQWRATELQTQAEKYIESYAMSSCQAICEDMQKKLPRELRDNIYECIIGKDIVHKVTTKYSRRLEDTYNTHFCDAKYMGRITKSELAETWYRLVLFKIPSGVDIERFLHRDMWQLGLIPYRHIHKVTYGLSGLGYARTNYDLELLQRLPKLATINIVSPFARLDNFHVMHLVPNMVQCDSFFQHMLNCGTSIYIIGVGVEVQLKKGDLNERRWTEILKIVGRTHIEG
jgi:hypothetical protein